MQSETQHSDHKKKNGIDEVAGQKVSCSGRCGYSILTAERVRQMKSKHKTFLTAEDVITDQVGQL
jgi:hypothetical protein